MAEYTPDRIKCEALRAVNHIREADGQEPLTAMPCGNPGDVAACPIARALTYGDDVALVTRARIQYLYADREIKIPMALARFVRAFDARELRELICK